MSIRTNYGIDILSIYTSEISAIRGDTILIPIMVEIKESSSYRAHLRQNPNDEEYFVLEVEEDIVVTPNQSELLTKGTWVAELEQLDAEGDVTTLQRTYIEISEDYTRDSVYPIRRDYVAIKGDTWDKMSSGVIVKIDGELVNLTGSEITFQLLTSAESETPLIEKSYSEGGILVSDPSSGEFVINPFIIDLDPKIYVWRLIISLVDGYTKTIGIGFITVK